MKRSIFLVMALLLAAMPTVSCGPGEETTPTINPTIAPTITPTPSINTGLQPHDIGQLAPGLLPTPIPIVDNPYQEGGEEFYKVQIHAHSDRSDGAMSPYEVEEAYSLVGYDAIFLTDHNNITSDPGASGILHIDSAEDGDWHKHHLLALGIDPNRVWQYYYTVREDVDEEPNGMVNWDTGDCENVYRRIEYYEYVGIAVLAHPKSEHDCLTWCCCGWAWDELSSNWTEEISAETHELHNYTGIEIYNSSESANLLEAFCTDWWDQLLKMRKKVWGFAGDDFHNLNGNLKSFNRSWIVVRSNLPESTDASTLQADIIRNIKAGNFYTVVRSPEIAGNSRSYGPIDYGPELRISVNGSTIRVDTDRDSDFAFYIGTKSGSGLKVATPAHRPGEELNKRSATYTVNVSDDIYVRVQVRQVRDDGETYVAYSQPLFINVSAN